MLAEHAPHGVLSDVVAHKGGKVCLNPAEILAEIARLGTAPSTSPQFPLSAIGIRELQVAEQLDAQQPHPDEGQRAGSSARDQSSPTPKPPVSPTVTSRGWSRRPARSNWR